MNDPEIWEHYCEVEHSLMGVGKNEPCNWCGKTEEDFNMDKTEKQEPYPNYSKETLEILKRIDLKLEFLASRDKNDYTSFQMWLDMRDEQACILYARYSTIERDDYLPSANAR